MGRAAKENLTVAKVAKSFDAGPKVLATSATVVDAGPKVLATSATVGMNSFAARPTFTILSGGGRHL